jgi:hypothetical protein
MDVLMTFVIILIIGLAVAPFFLLSGEFQPKRKKADQGDGPITPVPTADGAPFFPKKSTDSDPDGDGDGGDGGGGGGD